MRRYKRGEGVENSGGEEERKGSREKKGIGGME